MLQIESELFLGYILENNLSGHNPFYRSVCSCGDLAERGKCEFTRLSHWKQLFIQTGGSVILPTVLFLDWGYTESKCVCQRSSEFIDQQNLVPKSVSMNCFKSSHLLRLIFSFWSTMPFCDGLVYSYCRENSNLHLQGKFASLVDWHISPLQHHIITQEWKCEN